MHSSLCLHACVLMLTCLCPHKRGKDDEEEEDDKEEDKEEDEITTTVCPYAFIWCP